MNTNGHVSVCRLLFPLVVSAIALLAGCRAPSLVLEDPIRLPGATTELRALVEAKRVGLVRSGVKGATVSYYADSELVGVTETDSDGLAALQVDLPESRTVRAEVRAGLRTLSATRPVTRWQPNRTIVCVDVDETLCKADYATLLLEDREDDKSEPIEGAAEALRRIAERYNLFYFTARPHALQAMTRRWLDRHGFPQAPIVMAPEFSDTLTQGGFKESHLRHLRILWPDLLIGIGDKSVDVNAYRENGMLAVIFEPDGEESDDAALTYLTDWSAIRELLLTRHRECADPAVARARLARLEISD